MRFIDPHIHASVRTTQDYEAMAAAGIVAIIEPAFWIGQPRTSAGSYVDYLSSLGRLGALPRRPVRHPPLLRHRPQLRRRRTTRRWRRRSWTCCRAT